MTEGHPPVQGDPEPSSCYRTQSNVRDAPGFSCVNTLTGHGSTVTSLRFFSSDGGKFVSGSGDGTARVWDLERGVEVSKLDSGHDGGKGKENGAVNCVDVGEDGDMIVTSSDDFKARMWDSRAPKAPVLVLRGHTHVVTSCSLAPTGQMVATGSFDETARLWDPRTGGELAVIAAHTQPVTCVQFSKGSVRPNLATASFDGTCRIWSSHNRECLRTIVPTNDSGERAALTSVRFTPNNQYLLLNSLHNKLLLFDPKVENGNLPAANVPGLNPDAVVLPVLKKTYEGHMNSDYLLQSGFMTRCTDGAKLVLSGSEDHHVRCSY